MSKKGLLITFEGGDGAGKSSLIDQLSEFFREKNIPFLKTREPGGTALSEEIRNLILHRDMCPYTELALYLASRAEHTDKVLFPALQEDKIVLCDRFHDSTLAYQGYARGLDVEKVKQLCLFLSQNLVADITFYLDIDPETGLQRVSYEKSPDRLEKEKIDFHRAIRKAFLKIAEQESQRFCIIDASVSKKEVFFKALDYLKEKNVV